MKNLTLCILTCWWASLALSGGLCRVCLGLDFTDNGGREGKQGEQPGFDTTLTVER